MCHSYHLRKSFFSMKRFQKNPFSEEKNRLQKNDDDDDCDNDDDGDVDGDDDDNDVMRSSRGEGWIGGMLIGCHPERLK